MKSLCQPILDNIMAHQYFLLCPPKHWMKITGITMEWFHVDWHMPTNADCEVHDAVMSKSYISEYHNGQKKQITTKLVQKQQTIPYLCVCHPTVFLIWNQKHFFIHSTQIYWWTISLLFTVNCYKFWLLDRSHHEAGLL